MLKFNNTKLLVSTLKLGTRSIYTPGKRPSAKQFHVSNIPHDIEPHKVKDIFSKKVPVHFCSVPKDGNGKSLGYCFVTIDADQEDWFRKCFDGQTVSGKRLTIAPTHGKITIPIGKRNPG